MTAVAFDNNTKFYWLTSAPSSNAAVTQAEIGAGTLVTGVVGFDTPNSEAEVDTSDIDSLYDTSVVGTTKAGPIMLTIKRDDTTETAGWDLFATPRTNGYLVKTLDGAAAQDLAQLLDLRGVCVRHGHHCTMPLMQFFGVPATARASFGMYNTREEVDVFIEALLKARDMF